jgi:hypothetical protein
MDNLSPAPNRDFQEQSFVLVVLYVPVLDFTPNPGIEPQAHAEEDYE